MVGELDCLFCKIVQGKVPSAKVYEDEDVFAFLDINPVNPGHTLVVSKRHFINIFDVPEEELKKLIVVVKKLSRSIKEALGADGINIEMNNEKGAGQLINHIHFHIIPRFEGDGLRHWPGKEYQEGEKKEIAQKIREKLEE